MLRAALLIPVGALFFFLAHDGTKPGDVPATALQQTKAVVLLRHGDATVGEDSHAGLQLADCTTQRNLSDKGREQARDLGRAFRERGLHVGKVLASPYCRTLETAELMDLGPVERASIFAQRDDEQPGQFMVAARAAIETWSGPGALVIVTHGSTIKALTGVAVRPANAVVLDAASARAKFPVVASIQPGTLAGKPSAPLSP